MISQAAAEESLDFLLNNAADGAKIRANRLVLEEYTRVVKAEIMCQFPEMPVSAQERQAYAHPRYKAHLEVLRTAIALDTEHHFRREAADAKIRAWISQQASERAQRI